MHWVYLMLIAGVVGVSLLMSCSRTWTGYLQEATNHASAQDIQGILGPPEEIDDAQGGGTEWSYRVRAIGRPQMGIMPAEPYCNEYRLTFDDREILRYWQQKRC